MNYPNYFNIKEFFIDPALRDDYAEVTVHVVDKLIQYHLPILNEMRYNLNEPIYISKHSGYRSVEWEKEHDRSGTSEHTFRNLGAVDITADNIEKLVELAKRSKYKRVCYYPDSGFIHCDMKGDNHHYFEDHGDGWEYRGKREVKI